MPNYISIDENEVNALILAFENKCQSFGQSGKNVIMMVIHDDKCDITYDDNSFDYFSSPYFSIYFEELQKTFKITDDTNFPLIIRTDKLVARSGYENILVRYIIIKETDKLDPIVLSGKISKLSDKQDMDKRIVEEIKKTLNTCNYTNCINLISEESLDISHRFKLEQS